MKLVECILEPWGDLIHGKSGRAAETGQFQPGGRAVSSGMLFSQIPWETIGSGASLGLVRSATLGGLAAGGCALLTRVAGAAPAPRACARTRWRPRHDAPGPHQAPA